MKFHLSILFTFLDVLNAVGDSDTTTTTTSTTTSTTTTTTTAPSQSYSWSCSFEDPQTGNPTLCDTRQGVDGTDDVIDWSLNRGTTPSEPTGPRRAHSGEYYVFIETSNRKYDDDAM